MIMYISQKCIIFAADLKNDTKVQQIFNTNKLILKIMQDIRQIIIFRVVDGEWQRVDSPNLKPPTLAEFLQQHNVIVDDDTQFLRIIRYIDKNTKWQFEYRVDNCEKITIKIYIYNIQ